ncbi:putative DNA binding HTH domain, Psq-type, Homeobox-like domain superfamily [Plasmopara halstedii]
MASPHARPTRSSSVARSLANAAAALRAQVQNGAATQVTEREFSATSQVLNNETATVIPVFDARHSSEQRTTDFYEREILFNELRERQLDKKITREYFVPKMNHFERLRDDEMYSTRRDTSNYGQHLNKDSHMIEKRTTFSTQIPQNDQIYRTSDNFAHQHHSRSVSPRDLPVSLHHFNAKEQTDWSSLSTGKSNLNQTSSSSKTQSTDNEDDVDGEVERKNLKRVRYLREIDRHNIIKRIENGEKQAALAREFGVTRAAICHIKKNRLEILSRYNSMVKSAQESESSFGPPGVEKMVHQVRATSVLLLLTILRDNRSSGATFRRVAGRLIMIVLEEALAGLCAENVEVKTDNGHMYQGLELRQNFCGVAIGAEGSPFLVLFHQMEPDAPQGSIHVQSGTGKQGQRVWRLEHMDLPADITQHKVLLFSSSCSSGNTECKAIEALCGLGCDEQSISLVVLLVASDGIVHISNRFPHVKIITGGIDNNVNSQTDMIVNGFGDFVTRYNSI